MSALRFLPLSAVPSGFLPVTFLVVVLPALAVPGFFSAASSSSPLSSSAAPFARVASSSSGPPFFLASSSLAASFALSLASRASFFRCAFSFLTLRHAAMCSFAAILSTLFLQCLHCCSSGVSSSGRPVVKASRVGLSKGLTTGPGDAAVMAFVAASFFFFSSAVQRHSVVRCRIF